MLGSFVKSGAREGNRPMNTDGRVTPEGITGRTFKKVRRGYRVGEVDHFLERVASDIGRLREHVRRGSLPVEPLLTAEQVEQKKFTGAWRGYTMPEVDEFLDGVVVELRKLHEELAEAEEWRSAPRAPLQPPLPAAAMRSLPPPEPSLGRPLNARDVASKVFPREPHGYRVDEVDQFLGFVAVELARVTADPDAMPRLGARDIAAKRFTLGPRGYVMHEVDDFLTRLATELAERENGWSNAG
jgi:DivIVA domain-containing protein